MINVYCSIVVREQVTASLGTIPRAVVHTTWEAFYADLRRSSCLVVVLGSATEVAGELDHLQELSINRSRVPLILSAPVNAAILDQLGSVRYGRFLALDTLADTLLDAIREILARSPRQFAAHALKDSAPLSESSLRVVEEVLLSPQAVHDEIDLEARVRIPLREIRENWRADVYPQAPVRLTAFIQLGRHLREAEYLKNGLDVLEVAFELGVDESTIHRDLRKFSHLDEVAASDTSPALLEFLGAFRLIGGPVIWGERTPFVNLAKLFVILALRRVVCFVAWIGAPRF